MNNLHALVYQIEMTDRDRSDVLIKISEYSRLLGAEVPSGASSDDKRTRAIILSEIVSILAGVNDQTGIQQSRIMTILLSEFVNTHPWNVPPVMESEVPTLGGLSEMGPPRTVLYDENFDLMRKCRDYIGAMDHTDQAIVWYEDRLAILADGVNGSSRREKAQALNASVMFNLFVVSASAHVAEYVARADVALRDEIAYMLDHLIIGLVSEIVS